MAKNPVSDDPFQKDTPLFRVTKKYTPEDLENMSGEMMERELEDRRKEKEREENPQVSLNGDIGRDDTPGPYFNWTITGTDPKRMVQINDKLYNMLKKYKKRRK